VNILFVSYGGAACNSSPFIVAYADALSRQGVSAAVALAQRCNEDLREFRRLSFIATDHAAAFSGDLFPDGRPADVVHAWTPRENVRQFTAMYSQRHGSKVVVHMEDNEEHITSIVREKNFVCLLEEEEGLLSSWMPRHVSHPRRYKLFLDYADAATVVWPSLRDFLPDHYPVLDLPICPAFPVNQSPLPSSLAEKIQLAPDEKVLVYSGGINRINLPDQKTLYEAVVILNRSGVRCRLLRTGPGTIGSADSVFRGSGSYVTELGLLSQADLLSVMKLADAFVQPGEDDDFNRYRLPCKIPEFLALGCPVILPRANIGLELKDGEDALLLRDGSAQEIARQCRRIFRDSDLSARLSQRAARVSRRYFDLETNARRLAEFYEKVLVTPSYRTSSAQTGFSESTFLAGVFEQARGRNDSQALDRAVRQLRYESPPTRLSAQVYVRRGRAGFCEEKSETKSYNPGTLHRLEFAGLAALYSGSPVELRLDPVNMPGEFVLGQVQVVETKTQKVLKTWAANERFSYRGLVPLDESSGAFFALGNDPSLSLSAFTPPKNKSWTLTVEIRSAPLMGAALSPAVTAALQRERSGVSTLRETRRIASSLKARYRDVLADFHAAVGNRALQARRAAAYVFRLGRRLCSAEFPGLAWESTRRYGLGRSLRQSLLLFSGDRRHLANLEYNLWRRRFAASDDGMRDAMQMEHTGWEAKPMVSLVMPVYNPPVEFLREAVESVRAQIYPHWELCIADDASTDKEVQQIIREYAAGDPRIKTVFLGTNSGICGASNAALELVTGDWVGLFDHDDVLDPSALFEVARQIRRSPDAKLIYSDEDKIDEQGSHYGPYFKPDWNLALFHSHNLITHLGVYRTDLVRELEGFRSGFEGAQDYDLALRFTEKIKPEQIVHIPRVLYHWRAHRQSTADETSGAKPYAMLNGRKALQEHIDRSGLDGDVELIGHGFRVRYRLPDPAPMVSLIIPTRDRVDLIRRCVDTLLDQTDYPSFEIIIVDNGSTEQATLDFFEEAGSRDNVRVLRIDGPFNFARLNNEAVRIARGELIGLLNNDLEVMEAGWLKEMVSHACQEDVGAVGPLLLFPNRLVQHAGVILGVGGWAGHAHKGFPEQSLGYSGRLSLVSEFSAVTGACLLVRKALYEKLGGLDENLAVACNDVDFCLRLQAAGHRNIFTPFARLIHHESASRGYEDTPEKNSRFRAELAAARERWRDRLVVDPCYNPNLTLEREDFSLAWPPRVPPLRAPADKGAGMRRRAA
jgi:glycosyltransferase involved in cell wall biosynthesis